MVSGEESVCHCPARPAKGVTVIVICLGEVYLDVSVVTGHFMEIQRGNVTPDLQGIVHQGSDGVVAQLGLFWEGANSEIGRVKKRMGQKHETSLRTTWKGSVGSWCFTEPQ